MPPDVSRRRLLAGVGATAATGLLADRAGATADCETLESLRATRDEKRERLSTLETDLADLADEITALENAVAAAREQYRTQNHRFDAETRSEARSVGLDVRESVVMIELSFGQSVSSGTGWFATEDLVLTNSHVLEGAADADDIVGWTVDGEQIDLSFVDRVDSLSPDVGLVRSETAMTPLPTADSTSLSPGDPLVAVGHPGGYGNWQTTLGEFTERRERYRADQVVTTVPSLQGSSGSPTVTLDGDVVAMLKGAGGLPTLDGPPEPADPTPQTMPIAPEEDVLHDPVEVALEKMEAWT